MESNFLDLNEVLLLRHSPHLRIITFSYFLPPNGPDFNPDLTHKPSKIISLQNRLRLRFWLQVRSPDRAKDWAFGLWCSEWPHNEHKMTEANSWVAYVFQNQISSSRNRIIQHPRPRAALAFLLDIGVWVTYCGVSHLFSLSSIHSIIHSLTSYSSSVYVDQALSSRHSKRQSCPALRGFTF